MRLGSTVSHCLPIQMASLSTRILRTLPVQVDSHLHADKASNPEPAVQVDEHGHLARVGTALVEQRGGTSRPRRPQRGLRSYWVETTFAPRPLSCLRCQGGCNGFGLHLGDGQYRVALPLLGRSAQRTCKRCWNGPLTSPWSFLPLVRLARHVALRFPCPPSRWMLHCRLTVAKLASAQRG